MKTVSELFLYLEHKLIQYFLSKIILNGCREKYAYFELSTLFPYLL